MKPKKNEGTAMPLCRRMSVTGKGCHRTLLFYLLSFCILYTSSASAQDVSLKVSSDRSQIYLGESFNLTVEVSGSNSQMEPDLSVLTDCNIESLGSQDRSRRSISIINGRVQQESYTGRIFTFRITPQNTGTFKAGPVTLVLDNKTYSSPGPTLTVSGIEKQDCVLVTVTPSKESVLTDEPFEVEFSICIKRLKQQYAHYDPIDPSRPPSISVPYLQSDIKGLVCPNIETILQDRLVSNPNRAGFSINNIKLRDRWEFSLFNRFNEEKEAKFRLDRTEIVKNGEPYYEYSLKLKYTPEEEGSHTFGPIIFKGNVITGVDTGGNGTGKPVFAVGPARTVRVVPPPEAERPISYIGAIGTMLIAESEIDAQTCNLGDPLKLTVSVSGDFRLANISPPNLTAQKDLSDIFRIYEDTIHTETINEVKKYMYTVRPKIAGTIEVPPVSISFYDKTSRSYKTVQTKAIPLKVNEAVKVSENFIIDTATNRSTEARFSRAASTLLVAPLNVSPAGCVTASPALTGWQKLLFACAPFIFIMAILANTVTGFLQRNSKTRTREREMKKALHTIKRAQASKDAAEISHLLLNGIRQYMAAFFNRLPESITPTDARALLKSSRLSPDNAVQLADIFERHFNISYNSSAQLTTDINSDPSATLTLIKQLESRK